MYDNEKTINQNMGIVLDEITKIKRALRLIKKDLENPANNIEVSTLCDFDQVVYDSSKLYNGLFDLTIE